MPDGARDRLPADGLVAPLDAADPRFAGSDEAHAGAPPRRLVDTRGPGASEMDVRVRILRVGIPAVALLVLAGVVAVFAIGLDPGEPREVVGTEAAVRAAVAERPRRVCLRGAQPCAWLTLASDGELVAYGTNGPVREEYGRMGVAWCASSGYFGSNTTGSRYDADGNLLRGPASRGLDRVRVERTADGRVAVDFSSLRTGLQPRLVDRFVPATGPDCAEIPFDREADLDLDEDPPRESVVISLTPVNHVRRV